MDHTATEPPFVPARISIVGDGRLGGAFARALDHAGVSLSGPYGRGEVPQRSDALLLCVPDSEIQAAAGATVGAAPLVGHTSGATPLTALAAAGVPGFGVHPLQSFAGEDPPARFHGAGCAIAGSTPEALAAARGIAEAVGMRPFVIEDAARPAYHAAASVAANFLVTLQAAAEEVAAGAGLAPSDARALLAPLVATTVENWASLGPQAALTGPVARGDDETVERQRAAVLDVAPHLITLFDELVERTRSLAGQGVPA
jgi:predicted short-subunit dehydrogenase-like oxidoreductase (DUF2520 family)